MPCVTVQSRNRTRTGRASVTGPWLACQPRLRLASVLDKAHLRLAEPRHLKLCTPEIVHEQACARKRPAAPGSVFVADSDNEARRLTKSTSACFPNKAASSAPRNSHSIPHTHAAQGFLGPPSITGATLPTRSRGNDSSRAGSARRGGPKPRAILRRAYVAACANSGDHNLPCDITRPRIAEMHPHPDLKPPALSPAETASTSAGVTLWPSRSAAAASASTVRRRDAIPVAPYSARRPRSRSMRAALRRAASRVHASPPRRHPSCTPGLPQPLCDGHLADLTPTVRPAGARMAARPLRRTLDTWALQSRNPRRGLLHPSARKPHPGHLILNRAAAWTRQWRPAWALARDALELFPRTLLTAAASV